MKLSDISWRSLLPSFTGGVWGWVFCFLLTSCVLTMEDYTLVPEEERGVGQPYTYKDSLVTCTYQYREGVKQVTQNWLSYVMGVQDSTIYVSDNIPEDWLPQVGGHLSAGMSRTFPYGLCHRVISMERRNGLIAITLTEATVDDVFAELDVVADLDNYTLPDIEMTNDSAGQPNQIRRITRGGVEDPHFLVGGDGTIFDFTYIDEAANTLEGKYLKTRTRSESDEKSDDDGHTVTDGEEKLKSTHLHWEFDPSGWPSIKESGFTVKPSLEFDIYKDITIKCHKEEWKKLKKSEEWTERWVTTKTEIKGGVFAEMDVLGNNKVRNAIDKNLWDKGMRGALNIINNHTHATPYIFDPRTLYIGLGTLPLAIRVHLSSTLSASVGLFGSTTITDTEKVERVTIKRNLNETVETTELIREASREGSGCFGGQLEFKFEFRIGVGVLIGKLGTGVGVDGGAGIEAKATFDCMTTSIDDFESDYPIDDINNKSGFHFTVTGFVDFEVFTDFAGEPLVSHRIQPENLRWKLKEVNWYIFPQIDNKLTTGTYKYDYSDKERPKVNHTRKLVFNKGFGFDSYEDDVYPVYMLYKGSMKSKPTMIEPYSYTGKQAKQGNLYPFEVNQTYYFKCETHPTKDKNIWFVPALKYKDGKVEEYRNYVTKWGGSDFADNGGGIVKHLELYQKSSNEKDDTKNLFDKDWDFYHLDDVIEINNVPQEYLKLGYIINVVDAKNRNVIKKSDVYVMGHTLQSTGEQVVKPGIYKVSFDIGIPSDGRGPVTNPLVPSVKAYPILTVQPYWEIYDDGEGKYKKFPSEEKCISLKFPYTTDYSYKKANFTQKITQPIRQ